MPTTAHVYPVETGWFEGHQVQYYNLGLNTPLGPDDPSRVQVAPVWVFATGVNADGSPIKFEGQASLFDVAPGDPAYSDLWQAHFVTPPEGYVANSINTADALLASGLTIEKKAMFVNCPVVPAGSSLADNALPLKDGWVAARPVVYFDFGVTSPKPAKMYVFVTGFDDKGSPRLVPGQHFVFDAARTSAGYSDFWVVSWVTVAAGYMADSIRSAADIDPAKVTASTIVVNYPHKK